MDVKELSREQLEELKQRYYCENNNASWEDLANIDTLVSDEEIFEEYSMINFCNDDFCCSMGCDGKYIDEDMTSYDDMVKEIDDLMIKHWNEYSPSDLNEVIIRLIQNHGVYMNEQPYYIDYLIEDLKQLKEV